MLDQGTLERLSGHLGLLRHRVQLHVVPGNGELEAFCAEVASLSSLIETVPSDSLQRPGSVGLSTEGKSPRIWFSGTPLGHEFTSFVLALLHIGGHAPKISDAERDGIKSIATPVLLETFYSRSCQNCPETVQALNVCAALNEHVVHVAIDGAAYQDEVRERGVLSVPATFSKGTSVFTGRTSLNDVLRTLAPPRGGVSGPAQSDSFDVLVVGAGPAGCTAALYASRKGVPTALVAERMGGQLLDTAGIDNYPGVLHTEGAVLAREMEQQVRHQPVRVFEGESAVSLESTVEGFVLHLASGNSIKSRSVILAPGARWRQLGVQGEEEYLRRGVTFCPHCDGPLFAGLRVAVIGGGNSGVEAALDLAGIAEHVDVVEYAPNLRADEVLLSALRRRPNVSLHTEMETLEILGDGSKVSHLRCRSRRDGTEHLFEVSGVFIQVGLQPRTDWVSDMVETVSSGEIKTSPRGETSVPGIFAAGDASTEPYKQIVAAAGSGSRAAIAAFEYLVRQDPLPDAAILQLKNPTVAKKLSS